jgi:transposase, IS6 family
MILNARVEKLKRRSKDDFKGRHFEATLILQAVSWYLRYPLSYRDIEELFRERGLEVDHSTLNRWVLAYAPLIERRLRRFRKPHCGSIRVDETYIKIRGQWRYLYRALDKHGTPVDFLLTAKRDLEAAKRFFRKALQEEPLLSPDRIGTDGAGPYPPAITAARKDRLLPHDPVHYVTKHLPRPLRHQTPAAGDRERPLPREEAHATDRGLSILRHSAAHHSGVRGDAVAAQGLRLCRRLDGPRAEPTAGRLFRSSAG